MTARGALLCAFFVVLGGLPANAGADPAEDAADHNRQGKVLYGSGRYEAALAEFSRAWEISKDPRYLFNAARTQERMGRADDAVDTLHVYLRHVDDEEARGEALEAIERLCPSAGRALLRVRSNPDGAGITVRTVDTGRTTPALLCVHPGAAEVRVVLSGFESASRALRLSPAGSEEVSFVLAPPAPETPTEPPPRPRFPDEPDSGLSGTWKWSLLGGGAASAALGGLLVHFAFDRYRDADEIDPVALGSEAYDREFDDLTASGRRLQWAGAGAFVASAALIAPVIWTWGDGAEEVGAVVVATPSAMRLRLRF